MLSVLSQIQSASDNKTQGILLPQQQHYGAVLPTLKSSLPFSLCFLCGMKGRGAWNRVRPVITAVLSYHREAFKLVLLLPGRLGLLVFSGIH